MIVVATSDFELYHVMVNELRARDLTFTTVEPDDELPISTSVVITDESNADDFDEEMIVIGDVDAPRESVESAIAKRASEEPTRTVIGVDPGTHPGIAVCRGNRVIAVHQVELAEAIDLVQSIAEVEEDPLVRVGDGARIDGTRFINALEGLEIELVDETGTTPSLGRGVRESSDIIAAINIAQRPGGRIDSRPVEVTPGEIQVIKDRSRDRSDINRTIDEALARRVATGELSLDDALEIHRKRSDDHRCDG